MMFVIGYHIGWRAGPIRAIQWPQADFNNRVIYPPADQAENKWVGAAPIYGDMERALREAQLWLMRKGGKRGLAIPGEGEKEKRPDRLPPLFWAGFVLSGDWR